MDWHNRQTWEFINSFSNWFSALGTILVVIVSLYLARKGNKIQLEARALKGLLVLEGGEKSQECVWVEVVNVARRNATVNLVFFRSGIFKTRDYFWRIPTNERSTRFPTQLHDGEHARWVMELKEFDSSVEALLKDISFDFFTSLRLWAVKVGVRTSTGEFFTRRLQGGLRDYLWQKLQARQSQ